jgi:hypothetical protein
LLACFRFSKKVSCSSLSSSFEVAVDSASKLTVPCFLHQSNPVLGSTPRCLSISSLACQGPLTIQRSPGLFERAFAQGYDNIYDRFPGKSGKVVQNIVPHAPMLGRSRRSVGRFCRLSVSVAAASPPLSVVRCYSESATHRHTSSSE